MSKGLRVAEMFKALADRGVKTLLIDSTAIRVPQHGVGVFKKKEAGNGMCFFHDKAFSFVKKKYKKLDPYREAVTEDGCRLQKKEEKLRREVAKTGSIEAARFFDGWERSLSA